MTRDRTIPVVETGSVSGPLRRLRVAQWFQELASRMMEGMDVNYCDREKWLCKRVAVSPARGVALDDE